MPAYLSLPFFWKGGGGLISSLGCIVSNTRVVGHFHFQKFTIWSQNMIPVYGPVPIAQFLYNTIISNNPIYIQISMSMCGVRNSHLISLNIYIISCFPLPFVCILLITPKAIFMAGGVWNNYFVKGDSALHPPPLFQ